MVKFQTHCLSDEQLKRNKSRHGWIKFNEELTPLEDFWEPLAEYVKSLGMPFITTPMSEMAAGKVQKLVDVWKVGSADLTDNELLRGLKSTHKPIIISTGMSTPAQVKHAVKLLEGADIAILHCVSIYPCPPHLIHLKTIKWLERFGKPVGFSDHTTAINTPAVAVRDYGVRIIEKHFTLDPKGYGPDHKFALTTKRFVQMVEKVREAELARYGHGKKKKIIYPQEQGGWKTWRK